MSNLLAENEWDDKSQWFLGVSHEEWRAPVVQAFIPQQNTRISNTAISGLSPFPHLGPMDAASTGTGVQIGNSFTPWSTRGTWFLGYAGYGAPTQFDSNSSMISSGSGPSMITTSTTSLKPYYGPKLGRYSLGYNHDFFVFTMAQDNPNRFLAGLALRIGILADYGILSMSSINQSTSVASGAINLTSSSYESRTIKSALGTGYAVYGLHYELPISRFQLYGDMTYYNGIGAGSLKESGTGINSILNISIPSPISLKHEYKTTAYGVGGKIGLAFSITDSLQIRASYSARNVTHQEKSVKTNDQQGLTALLLSGLVGGGGASSNLARALVVNNLNDIGPIPSLNDNLRVTMLEFVYRF